MSSPCSSCGSTAVLSLSSHAWQCRRCRFAWAEEIPTRAVILRWLREEVAPDLGDERRVYRMVQGIADAIDDGVPEKWLKSQEGGDT